MFFISSLIFPFAFRKRIIALLFCKRKGRASGDTPITHPHVHESKLIRKLVHLMQKLYQQSCTCGQHSE